MAAGTLRGGRQVTPRPVVALLVATYRTDRDTIVRAIATPATRGVRDFADAFRFRKHGDR